MGIKWAVTGFCEIDREALSATELVTDTNTEWLFTWNLFGFLCVSGGQGFGMGTQNLRQARFDHILNYNVRIKSGHDQWVVKVNSENTDVRGTSGRVQALSTSGVTCPTELHAESEGPNPPCGNCTWAWLHSGLECQKEEPHLCFYAHTLAVIFCPTDAQKIKCPGNPVGERPEPFEPGTHSWSG